MYKRLLTTIFLLILCATGQARTRVDLFRADIPVQAEGKKLQAGDARRALAQVLVRITGQSALMARPDIQQALGQAGRLVFRFRFYQKQGGTAAPPETRVEVGFEPEGVRALVRRLSLPWWGAERPELLWTIVLEQDNRRSLVNAENFPALQAGMQTARERGLPLTLPLLDLADQRTLSPVELWGGFTDGLSRSRQRYGSDGWLLLRLESHGSVWKARWQLSLPDEHPPLLTRWEDIGTDPEILLAQGVDHASTWLAQRLAFTLSEQAQGLIDIDVEQLTALSDWLQLEQWLQQQPWTEHVELLQMHQGQARIRLQITTPWPMVRQALLRSGLLQHEAADTRDGERWLWAAP